VKLRPTLLGIALGVALVAVAARAPSVADPQLAGAVVAVAVMVLAVGVCWPVVALLGTRLRIETAAEDVLVGDTTVVRVRVERGPSSLRLRYRGADQEAVWCAAPRTVDLPVRVDQRGVLVALDVDVVTDGPFGVLRAWRTLRLPLEAPLYVAPSPLHAQVDLGVVSELADGDPVASLRAGGDTIRSVRPYVPGDPAHLVHWPTSARLGAPVVREFEPPSPPGVAVVAELSAGGAAAEAVASRASGVVRDALAQGGRVVLCTSGLDGPVARDLRSVHDADRQLAAAMGGAPASPPRGWDVVELVAG
jgi:uncharacterized protein (DUF58 family)